MLPLRASAVAGRAVTATARQEGADELGPSDDEGQQLPDGGGQRHEQEQCADADERPAEPGEWGAHDQPADDAGQGSHDTDEVAVVAEVRALRHRSKELQGRRRDPDLDRRPVDGELCAVHPHMMPGRDLGWVVRALVDD